MSTYDSLFKTIEGYSTMTIEALQYSKIGKGECVLPKLADAASHEEDRYARRYSPKRRAEDH
jgi:hypothetical protein